MTRQEITDYQAERKAFEATKAGNAFYRFESTIGKAWITDQRENASISSMKRDWAAADAAREELIRVIKELQGYARERDELYND
jgi:hypothetical protein